MSGSDCQDALTCLVLRNVNDWWRARQLVRTQTNLAGGRDVFGSAYSTQVMVFQLPHLILTRCSLLVASDGNSETHRHSSILYIF